MFIQSIAQKQSLAQFMQCHCYLIFVKKEGYRYKIKFMIKTLLSILGIAMVLLKPSFTAKEVSDHIKYALNQGNAKLLSEHFNKTVEIVIDSEKIDHPKLNTMHAELILNSFFKKSQPQSFSYEFVGATSSIKYLTGHYLSRQGKYWVYIILKNQDKDFVINSIHFKKG
jgi:hypothetical protein